MSAEDALQLLSGLVMEDGTLWGNRASDFQWDDAEAILAEDGPQWHYLTRPRGGSKTTDLAGISLAWLATMALPSARGFVYAYDKEQATQLLDYAEGFVNRTPQLQGVVTINAFKLTSAESGATIEVRAVDGSGALGTNPSFLVLDEVGNWEENKRQKKLWAAVTSALSKSKGTGARCKFVCLTTAGEPSHGSYQVLQDAKKDPKFWHVHEVPGLLPWADEAELRAQPIRESEYARFHLNQWMQSEDRLVSQADLDAAAVLDGEQEPQTGIRYLMSVDLGLVHDATVVVVAHSEAIEGQPTQRRVVVDSLRRWRGSRLHPVQLSEIESYIALTSKRYHGTKVLCDPWQAAGLIQRLQTQGVLAEQLPFTAQSVGRLGQALHMALKNRLLWLPKDEDLLSELAKVRLRENGEGSARLDHDASGHDDQAVCIAMCVATLLGEIRYTWIEEMQKEHPTHSCGQPNPKWATRCKKCGAELTPTDIDDVPVDEPQIPFDPWGRPAVGELMPDQVTVSTLQMLEFAKLNGWTRELQRHF